MAGSIPAAPASRTVKTYTPDPSTPCPMTARREPSGDQAGNVKAIPAAPYGTTEPPEASLVMSRPLESTTARREVFGEAAMTDTGGGTTGATLMTPRPDTNARTTIETMSVTRSATVSARRPRLGGWGSGGPGSSKTAGSAMATRYVTAAYHGVDAPM